MIRHVFLVAGVAAAVHCAAAVALAQPVVIRGNPTCGTCIIDRQLIVRIGEGDDELINGPVVTPLARDRHGRFFVNDQDDGPIKVFASDGRFSTLLGGTGDGPGESRRAATAAIGLGDSVFVTDRSLMRGSVYGPDLKFVRSFPLPFLQSGVHSQVVDGLLVVNAQASEATGTGFPLLALDARGRLAKRIGPEQPRIDRSQSELMERVLGRAGSGSGDLLVAHHFRYQWWKLSGTLDPDSEFIREASWFRGYEPPNAAPMQMDGVSYLKAIWEDGEGLTWVALGTIHIRYTGEGQTTERTESSRIEVLDVKNRTVLVSVEFPDRLVSGFSDGTVVLSEVRDDGRTVLTVLRLFLRRPAARAGF